MGWHRVLLLCAAFGCTKTNPAKHCDDGSCIDPSFPFCDVSGAISGEPGSCLAVDCVPGSIAACDASQAWSCSSAGNSYDVVSCSIACDAPTNVCLDKCSLHSQCSSGICKADGKCAEELEIAYTNPIGARYSDCSRSVPCALERALELAPPVNGQLIALAEGTYALESSQTVRGNRILVGKGADFTTLTNGSTGPVFIVEPGADVTFDSVRIANATSGTTGEQIDNGWGIFGEEGITPRSLHLFGTVFANNGLSGGAGGGAIDFIGTVEIRKSIFNGNYAGAFLSGPVTVDGSMFVSNLTFGLSVNTAFSITNTFFVRNQVGVSIGGATTMPLFAFNTIADNTAVGVSCIFSSGYAQVVAEDNIIAGNKTNTNGSGDCDFAASLVTADRSALQFLGGDTAPFNYHLGAGSIAIDAARTSGFGHDYDGESRPNGSRSDVGADEAF